MAFRIFQSVLFVLGIEVPAGRLEIGSITLRRLVHVNGVLTRRQILQIEVQRHTIALGFLQGHGPDTFALGILELSSLFVCRVQQRCSEQKTEGENGLNFHAQNYRRRLRLPL